LASTANTRQAQSIPIYFQGRSATLIAGTHTATANAPTVLSPLAAAVAAALLARPAILRLLPRPEYIVHRDTKLMIGNFYDDFLLVLQI